MADPSRDLFANNRIQSSNPSSTELRPATVLEKATSFLARSQSTDGRWPGLVHSSVRVTAEYVLLLEVLKRILADAQTDTAAAPDEFEVGTTTRDEIAKTIPNDSYAARMRSAAAFISSQQQPSGLWNNGKRQAMLDTSVLAYLALRVAGHDAQSEHLDRARSAILAAGGVNACEPLTHYWFALLGEQSMDDCWPIPIELRAIPEPVVGSFRRIQLLGRVTLEAVGLLRSYAITFDRSDATRFASEIISELSARSTGRRRCPFRYLATEYVGRWWPGRRRSPIRFATLQASEKWLRDQIDTEHGISGDASATIWVALALLMRTRDANDPDVRSCLAFLDSVLCVESALAKCASAKTEVRSSAIAFRALGVAGMSMADLPIQRSVDWLLCHESHRAVKPVVRSEMSGWTAPGGTANCIDAETTAIVLLALREQFTETPPEISRTEDSMVAIVRASSAAFARRQIALLDRMAASSRRSRRWLVENQNVDGGWGRFGRCPIRRLRRTSRDASLWCKDLSVIDSSSITITSWVIEALSQWDHRREVVLSKAISFLRSRQQADGRWTESDQSILPTWRAISGLIAAGVSAEDSGIANGVAWLMASQSKTGGWCDLPRQDSLSTLSSVSVVQTAWAVLALIAAGVGNSSVVERGIQFLSHHQRDDGGWDTDELAPSYRASLDYGILSVEASAYPLFAISAYQKVAR